MAATGLDVFDKTLQTTNIWLNGISQDIGPDRQLAWHVLGVVLRALRDRLTVEDAAHLSAELPMLVRGAFYEQYPPARQPLTIRSRSEFVERVADRLHDVRPLNPEEAITAVFRQLSRHVPKGQIEKTREALPAEIRELWPTESGSAPA